MVARLSFNVSRLTFLYYNFICQTAGPTALLVFYFLQLYGRYLRYFANVCTKLISCTCFALKSADLPKANLEGDNLECTDLKVFLIAAIVQDHIFHLIKLLNVIELILCILSWNLIFFVFIIFSNSNNIEDNFDGFDKSKIFWWWLFI